MIQNAGTIHASNLEDLLVIKALRGDGPEQNAGTIHASNPEHLLVVKALRGDNPEQNAGTIHASNPEHLVFTMAPTLVGPWSSCHPFRTSLTD